MEGRRGWLGLVTLLVLLLSAFPMAALDAEVTWTLGLAPAVVTGSATNVTEDSAILHGEVLDMGDATVVNVSFEWGASPALGQETPAQAMTGEGAFEAVLTGLEPDREYYIRAKAEGNVTTLGETLVFRTQPAAFGGEGLLNLWLLLIILLVAGTVAYFAFRKYGLPPPLKKVLARDFKESGAFDKAVVSVDRALDKLAAEADRGGSEERKLAATTLLGSLLSDTPDLTQVSSRPVIDRAELKRREAIFRNRIRTMDRRLEANPNDAEALFAKAALLALRRDYRQAIKLLDKVTMIDPHYPGVWYFKARLYQLLGNLNMAELCLVSASKLERS